MNRQQIVVKLTAGFFLHFRDHPSGEDPWLGHLQFMGMSPHGNACTLSDGQLLEMVNVPTPVRSECTWIRPLDIVECRVVKADSGLVLTSIKRIYSGLIRQIGNPSCIPAEGIPKAARRKLMDIKTEIPAEFWGYDLKLRTENKYLNNKSIKMREEDSSSEDPCESETFSMIREVYSNKFKLINIKGKVKSEAFQRGDGKLRVTLFDSTGQVDLATPESSPYSKVFINLSLGDFLEINNGIVEQNRRNGCIEIIIGKETEVKRTISSNDTRDQDLTRSRKLLSSSLQMNTSGSSCSKRVSSNPNKTIKELLADCETFFATEQYNGRLTFKMEASLERIIGPVFYLACSNTTCSRKVKNSGNGVFVCPKCGNLAPNSSPIPKYGGEVILADQTGTHKFMFLSDEVGEALFEASIQEIIDMHSQDSLDNYTRLSIGKTFAFTICVFPSPTTGKPQYTIYSATVKSVQPDLPALSKRDSLLLDPLSSQPAKRRDYLDSDEELYNARLDYDPCSQFSYNDK